MTGNELNLTYSHDRMNSVQSHAQQLLIHNFHLMQENVSLRNTLDMVTGQHQQLTTEKATMASKLEELKDQNTKLMQENTKLKNQVEALRDRLADVETRLTFVESSLSIRDMGSQAETKLMATVFPDARTGSYMIRSLKNLRKFLENPASALKARLCGPLAPEEFQKRSDQAEIRTRLSDLDLRYPDAENMIKILKKDGDSVAHGQAKSVGEVLEIVKDNEYLSEAVKWALSVRSDK